MMGRVTRTALVSVAIVTGSCARAGAQELPWTAIVSGNLTTSSQLYYNPAAADPVARAEYLNLTSFFGFGAELKYQLPETHIAFGISTERIRARNESLLIPPPSPAVPVDDGYTVVPVEVTGYFIIPFSNNSFGVFMGGGAGAYFGSRSYSVGGTAAAAVSRSTGLGIHVLAGVDVYITDRISIIGQMKFRDLQFKSTNQFPTPQIEYQGVQVRVSTVPFESSVHTDGITFLVGLGFSF